MAESNAIEFIYETWDYYKVYVILSGLSAVVCWAVSARWLWRWVHILLVRTRHIADIDGSGRAELAGEVRCAAPLIFDGKSVVYYRKAQQYYRSGKNRGWRDRAVDEKAVKFDLCDATGHIAVIPKGAHFEIRSDRIEKHSATTRTVYSAIETGSQAYVLGYAHVGTGEYYIGSESVSPFVISDFSQLRLLFKFGLPGWLTAFTPVLVCGLAITLAWNSWLKPWSGTVTGKSTYRCGSKNRSTCYEVQIQSPHGNFSKKIDRGLWSGIVAGDYLDKPAKDYHISVTRE